MATPSTLQILWFGLIAVLWIGYFFLEGFDFGVGMLLPFVGRDDVERRMVIRTIGPVWDGNEVWLLTAGGAPLAAVPGWDATPVRGVFPPPLFLLPPLLPRGVALSFRHPRADPRGR